MPSPLDLAAIVLVLGAAAGALVMAVLPSFSRRYGGPIVLMSALGAVAGGMAGRLPAPLGALLVVVLGVFWLVDRGIPANRRRPGWLVALAVPMVAGALAAAVVVLLPSTVAGWM